MKVAITGATGFLGAAMCRELVAAGHEVVAIVRGTSDRWRLEGLDVAYRIGDVTVPTSLPGALAGCDWVVHAAGRLGEFGISEAEYMRLHVEGTRNVLEAAQGIEKVLVVSSPGVLGSGEVRGESAEYAPTNRYERSKAEAEKIALTYPNVIVVRPEFVYGPGDTHVLGLFNAVKSGRIFLIDGGESSCHPTYVDDAVRGMLLALEKGKRGEIYHITGKEPIKMRHFLRDIAAVLDVPEPKFSVPKFVMKPTAKLLETVGSRLGVTPPLTTSAVDFFSTSYRFSYEKAQRELGYEPQVDLMSGLRRTTAWYRERGYLDAGILPARSVNDLYPLALAEGEGVGTAYEYFVKRRALQNFLTHKKPQRMLIAGLPQVYGHSSDFFLLAQEFGAELTVIDERAEKLATTEALVARLQTDGRLIGLSVNFQQVNWQEALPFAENEFDLVVSSEVIQRLLSAERMLFANEVQRVGQHFAIFCPNQANASHVGRSGLSGLTLAELRGHFPQSEMSGLIDMPPFPPGIALSEEQRESAESGTIQQIGMWGLQQYSRFESLLPTKLRQHYAHIVYAFR